MALRDAVGLGLGLGSWPGLAPGSSPEYPGQELTTPVPLAGSRHGVAIERSGLWSGSWSVLGQGTSLAGFLVGLVVGLVYPQLWSSCLAFAQLAASDRIPVRLMRCLEDARTRGVLRTVGPVCQFPPRRPARPPCRRGTGNCTERQRAPPSGRRRDSASSGRTELAADRGMPERRTRQMAHFQMTTQPLQSPLTHRPPLWL